MSIRIDGHTDNVGGDQKNKELSLRRAEAVYNFLLAKGIPDYRIKYQGFGYSKPIASNSTEKGKALNRRTEIYIEEIRD